MDDKIEKQEPKIQADNQSIAIDEINISGNVTGNIMFGHSIVQPADARLRHELGILLKNVQTTWIKGVLEKSVHEAAIPFMSLGILETALRSSPPAPSSNPQTKASQASRAADLGEANNWLH